MIGMVFCAPFLVPLGPQASRQGFQLLAGPGQRVSSRGGLVLGLRRPLVEEDPCPKLRASYLHSAAGKTTLAACFSYPESGAAQLGGNGDFPVLCHWSVAHSPLEGDTSNRLLPCSFLEQAWYLPSIWLEQAGSSRIQRPTKCSLGLL